MTLAKSSGGGDLPDLRAPVVTCDERLARSHGHTAEILQSG